MSMKDWAEKEIEIACKRENPNWDGESFDYGCSCYQSALKAYKSLCEDDHSGMSFDITKNILIRLMNGLPLSPITDDDFDEIDGYTSINGKTIQCPRMSSLFKEIDKDNNISYSDVNRYYCIDVNNPKNTYGGGLGAILVDKLFPITLPYTPSVNKYKFYCEDFLQDPKNGDYDHQACFYVITPNGDKIELDEFYKEVDGEMIRVSKEEYLKDKEERCK